MSSMSSIPQPHNKVERWAFILVTIGLVLALLFAIFVTREAVVSSNTTTEAYVIDSPIVVTDRIEDVEGPAVYVGDVWNTETYRCLTLDGPVVVRWNVRWISGNDTLLPGDAGAIAGHDSDSGGAGCAGSNDLPLQSISVPPKEMTAGTWRFSSDISVTDEDGRVLSDTVATSEWVTVVERLD